MNLTMKALAGMLLALLLAAAGGWVWGATGRWSAQDALRASAIRLHQTNARANLLQARIDLAEANFGNAGQSLTAARADLLTVAQAFDQAGNDDAARRLRQAIERIGEAIQLAGRLDQAASARAADALRLLATTP